jgi:hypothetical protein
MSFSDERIAIEKRLNDRWTTTPIAFENVPFSAPNDGSYVALDLLTGDGQQQDIASNARHRFVGVIQVRVVVPAHQGSSTARGYADTIAGYFRGATFSHGSSGDIVCRTPSINQLGITDGQYTLAIRIPYYRDAIF